MDDQPKPPEEHTAIDADDLQRHSADNLRAASRTFSPRTCSTFDGLHPRHFDALSTESLVTLAVLLDAFEETGRWPPCLAAVITALIPKARGWVRAIGLFCGVYRLWARARRREATV